MKILPVILVSVSLLAVTIVPVFAEDAMTTSTTDVTPTATVTTAATSTTTSLKQVVRPTLKAMKADAKETMLAAVSKAKEAFRTKLAAIKDEKKKTTVENLDTRIATVNQNRTNEMTQNLTKLSEILDRVSSRSAIAKAAGQDTKSLESDITSARSAITLAQTAVAAQAAKSYTINITTETNLRTNVMTTLALFRKDIEAAHKKVMTARDGVRVAALELEKVKNPAVSMTPTPTASSAATNQ